MQDSLAIPEHPTTVRPWQPVQSNGGSISSPKAWNAYRAEMYGLPAAPTCPECGGLGWLRMDVQRGDPAFGKLVPCGTCAGDARLEWITRRCGLEGAEFDARIDDWNWGPWPELHGQRAGARTAMEGAIERRAGFLAFWGDFGCLAAGTKIYNPLTDRETPVDEICGHHCVLAWHDGHLTPAWGNKPFVKGVGTIYRVRTQSGCEIEVTGEHAFLTPHGYQRLDHLCIGSEIGVLPILNQTIHTANGPHYRGRASSYLDYWLSDYHQCDAQSLYLGAGGQFSQPLQGDAHEHIQMHRPCSRKDDPGESKPFYNHICIPYNHHAKQNFENQVEHPAWPPSQSHNDVSFSLPVYIQQANPSSPQFDGHLSLQPQIGNVIDPCKDQEEIYKPLLGRATSWLLPISFLSLKDDCGLFQSALPPGTIDHIDLTVYATIQQLSLYHSATRIHSDSSRTPKVAPERKIWDIITGIDKLSTGPYYDFHVPVYNNYWAQGFINHNSGKTFALQIMVNELRLQRVEAFYAPLAHVLEHLRSLYHREEETSDFWQRLLDIPVLALDEVTRFHGTSWAQERLWMLADVRYRRMASHLTVFATNDDPNDSLPTSEPIGYLYSRLRQGHLVELRGDLRPVAGETMVTDERDDEREEDWWQK